LTAIPCYFALKSACIRYRKNTYFEPKATRRMTFGQVNPLDFPAEVLSVPLSMESDG
jgi:hypothetical protein